MKLKLVEDKQLEESLIDITYNRFDRRIQRIVDMVETNKVQLEGKMDSSEYKVESFDICYIE